MSATHLAPAEPKKIFPSNPLLAFALSSIGKKWIVGISGGLLILFVIAHLAGNLTIYIGPYGEGINIYAEALHASALFLWAARLGLLAVFVVHIATTLSLVLENRRARPQGYLRKNRVQSTLAVRTMALSGLVVLAFIIFHVLQFAVGLADPHLLDAEGRHDVAAMIILSFHHPLVTAFYLLGLALLGMHLSHGISSVFQTFGLNGRKSFHLLRRGGVVLAWGLMAAFATIPVSAIAGILKVLPADQRPATPAHQSR